MEDETVIDPRLKRWMAEKLLKYFNRYIKRSTYAEWCNLADATSGYPDDNLNSDMFSRKGIPYECCYIRCFLMFTAQNKPHECPGCPFMHMDGMEYCGDCYWNDIHEGNYKEYRGGMVLRAIEVKGMLEAFLCSQ